MCPPGLLLLAQVTISPAQQTVVALMAMERALERAVLYALPPVNRPRGTVEGTTLFLLPDTLSSCIPDMTLQILGS